MTQVSIAGIGAVASIASSAPALLDSLCEGRTGLAPLRGFDPSRFRLTHAFEIDDRPESGDTTARATTWLGEAISQALKHAGLSEDLSDVPVFVGSGLRELRSAELRLTHHAPFDAARLHFGPALREQFGAASTFTITNACSASLHTLGIAADLLSSGTEDTVVVAGSDSITASMFGLIDRVQAPPVAQVQPFDRHRRGVLMGEGAAAVVLRRGDAGPTRLRAVAMNCDAYNETAPDLDGISAAIKEAHARAGVVPGEIDLVIAHATGTLLNDEVEATALAQAFAGPWPGPLVTGIKSQTGHTSGASGLMSVVVAVESLRTGRVPAIAGLTEPVPEAAPLRLVTEPIQGHELRLVQVDAFGFGGVNAVAILEKVP